MKPVTGTFAHDKLLSFIQRPSWIRVLKMFGIATFPAIELVALTGTVFSFFGFVSQRFCILPIFTILWTLYYSLVDITGIFHQQCDDLLLEAGIVNWIFLNTSKDLIDSSFRFAFCLLLASAFDAMGCLTTLCSS